MSIYAMWDDGIPDEVWEKMQEERAKVVLQCKRDGHKMGAQRAGLDDTIFRVCDRCGILKKENQ